MKKRAFVFCVMGPTASGKTQLALQLVKKLPCDIISVDSAMVYRGMDIGTAKPTREQQAVALHALIDIRDPKDNYSAGDFYRDAQREIEKILQRDRIPLLVGGTMLYFWVLQQGMAVLPSKNKQVRAQLQHEVKQLGLAAQHARLRKIDPTAAERIHSSDAQRIQRALEVYELTGKTLTAHFSSTDENDLTYNFINIALAPAKRSLLHERIAERFQSMLQQGFVAEVETLYQRGDLNIDMPSMRAVGYRQVWQYLAGKLSHAEMQERGIIATRQLAKRQLTWLRKWQNILWLDSENSDLTDKVLTNVNC